jgi:hypothetical protein
VRYVFVESEEPDDHWGYLEVMGKRVLDLGCGYFGVDSTSTPAWFIEQGIFKLPETYAIETHDDALYEATLNKLRSCGYKIKTIVDLIHAQGCKVIHATR